MSATCGGAMLTGDMLYRNLLSCKSVGGGVQGSSGSKVTPGAGVSVMARGDISNPLNAEPDCFTDRP